MTEGPVFRRLANFSLRRRLDLSVVVKLTDKTLESILASAVIAMVAKLVQHLKSEWRQHCQGPNDGKDSEIGRPMLSSSTFHPAAY